MPPGDDAMLKSRPELPMNLRMNKVLIGAGLGMFLALSGMTAFDAGRYLLRSAPPSTASVERPLTGFSVDPTWIRSGQPNFRASETARSPDGETISGLWACDGPSRFEWTFGLDETVHLLEGEVAVEYLGRQFTLRPGDTATFHAGTRAVWTVREHAKKSYILHHPGRLVLLWRHIFPAAAQPDEVTRVSGPVP